MVASGVGRLRGYGTWGGDGGQKGTRKAHIVVGSHEANDNINGQLVQRQSFDLWDNGTHHVTFAKLGLMMVQWSSGWRMIRLTHRRSPVRSRIEPAFFYFFLTRVTSYTCSQATDKFNADQ